MRYTYLWPWADAVVSLVTPPPWQRENIFSCWARYLTNWTTPPFWQIMELTGISWLLGFLALCVAEPDRALALWGEKIQRNFLQFQVHLQAGIVKHYLEVLYIHVHTIPRTPNNMLWMTTIYGEYLIFPCMVYFQCEQLILHARVTYVEKRTVWVFYRPLNTLQPSKSFWVRY